jgi:hypothetical protein
VSNELSGKRPLFGAYCQSPDILPSQVVQYAAEMSEVFAIVLCFSTPELGCHGLFQVGSRTPTQHGLEIGIRAGENSRQGQFILTTDINGRVNGEIRYRECPPPHSESGLQIEIDTVYSVLVILDLNHSVVQYHDLNPAFDAPKLLYQPEIETYLHADWLRPLAFVHHLEFKTDNTLGQVWDDESHFPGTLHHCHQFRIAFPGDVHAWQEVHESILKQQRLALSVPGHRVDGLRTAIQAMQPSIAKHCLSMFVKVTIPVFLMVKDNAIEIIFQGSEATVNGLFDLVIILPVTASEKLLLHFHQSVCPGQVTSWSYAFEDGTCAVPCSGTSFPPIIGGLISSQQKNVNAKASFWKRSAD